MMARCWVHNHGFERESSQDSVLFVPGNASVDFQPCQRQPHSVLATTLTRAISNDAFSSERHRRRVMSPRTMSEVQHMTYNRVTKQRNTPVSRLTTRHGLDRQGSLSTIALNTSITSTASHILLLLAPPQPSRTHSWTDSQLHQHRSYGQPTRRQFAPSRSSCLLRAPAEDQHHV